MFRPTPRCIVALALGFPIALLPAVSSAATWVVWVAYLGALGLLVGLDGVLGVSRRRVTVEASGPGLTYLGHDTTLEVRARLRGARPGTPVAVRVDLSGHVKCDDAALLRTERQGRGKASLRLVPERRGDIVCSAVWLRWSGPFGLLARTARFDCDVHLAVAPDIHAVRQAALRLSRVSDFVAGLKRQKFIGDGTEFEALREYQPGYDHRAIDWKASARRRKLLVREYQAERNHRVLLAFDTGYLMSQPLEGLPRLDHAINAGLLLALLSLRMGDRVGMFGFDQEVHVYSEPLPGMQTIHRLMQHSAHLDYHPIETNFTRGLAELSARLRRRSIVVVLTDFADTITAEQMVDNMGRLARRHLVIFVSLRDRTLNQVAGETPDTFTKLSQAVVAGDLLRDREVVLQRLRRHGVFCIDAAPQDVTVQLLNRYLEVKQRGLI